MAAWARVGALSRSNPPAEPLSIPMADSSEAAPSKLEAEAVTHSAAVSTRVVSRIVRKRFMARDSFLLWEYLRGFPCLIIYVSRTTVNRFGKTSSFKFIPIRFCVPGDIISILTAYLLDFPFSALSACLRNFNNLCVSAMCVPSLRKNLISFGLATHPNQTASHLSLKGRFPIFYPELHILLIYGSA